ncbi:flagellar protein FlgN [Novosphingobium sp.]|jgi:hypothetical protein|uniref:flagellar protein FlgN n=1 Tax=Novosphingobium sp. TaxID=1874826 RepID=UPI0031CF3E49
MKHQFAGSSALLDNAPVSRGDTLRRMIELLRHEREALTGMDMDSIMGCAHDKYVLCEELEAAGDGHIDEETRGLIDAARRLNEVNRQLRNLIAANVSARLNALSGGAPLYKAQTGQALRPQGVPAYAYTGARA